MEDMENDHAYSILYKSSLNKLLRMYSQLEHAPEEYKKRYADIFYSVFKSLHKHCIIDSIYLRGQKKSISAFDPIDKPNEVLEIYNDVVVKMINLLELNYIDGNKDIVIVLYPNYSTTYILKTILDGEVDQISYNGNLWLDYKIVSDCLSTSNEIIKYPDVWEWLDCKGDLNKVLTDIAIEVAERINGKARDGCEYPIDVYIKEKKPEEVVGEYKEPPVFCSSGNGSVEISIPKGLYDKLMLLGILPNDIRSYNEGESDYSGHVIQPWAIWLEYSLNAWDADIIKRVLRTKHNEDKRLSYHKIIHVCRERLRQLAEQ